MAVNWFEGGRRISQLIIGLVAAGGALIVALVESPDPEFTTYGPSAPWIVTQQPCPENAHVEYLWDYGWGGDERGVRLCFIALSDGSFPIAVADPPPTEIERRKQDSAKWIAENNARVAGGDAPLIPPPSAAWFYTASEYSSRFIEYVGTRRSEFRVTEEMRQAAIERQSGALWDARKMAFSEALPWVAGICGFLWAFTFAMGWIIRGFAGIPAGQDFKPAKAKEETS